MGKENNCIRSFPARIVSVRPRGPWPVEPPEAGNQDWRDLRHDLLGALSAIQNTLFLLNREEANVSGRTRDYLDMIERQAGRMQAILEGAFSGGTAHD